jgi:hypothetical protein
MTQEEKLVECERCKKAAVIKQHIDFLKIGTNQQTGKGIYILYDHGTKNIHVNKKACTYGCNTIIVWDKDANRYRDLEGGLFHDFPCEGVERYRIMAENQREFIDVERRNQMIQEKQDKPVGQMQTQQQEPSQINLAKQETNPIAEGLAKTPSTEMSKAISTIWELTKEIDRKVSSFEQLKHDRGVMLEAIDKRFDSIDDILAEILNNVQPNQFKKGSELLNKGENQAPTKEELEAMFSEDEEFH